MHFFIITGPPAVGKMTVGQALCERLGYKLFHNHHSIEFALQYFDFGEKEMGTISGGIRKLMFKTISETDKLKGFVFTFVWAFELEREWEYVNGIKDQFESNGWKFHIVELESNVEVRLERNKTPNRLKHKPSKRDIEYSSGNIKKWVKEHRLNSNKGELDAYSYLKVNNESLSPEEVVDLIVDHFGLK